MGTDKKIIAAQGPLMTTVDHFWRMVLLQRVTLIVSVCKLEEGGRPKCHKYWPEGASDTDYAFQNLLSTVRVKTLNEKKFTANLICR